MENKIICGVDEAGRGPLVGPVTAAAVILNPEFPIDELKDSKKLSEKKRALLEAKIKEQATCWGIGWVWHNEIDELNIHHATLLAMSRALAELSVAPNVVLVDGAYCPEWDGEIEAVIKGDSIVPEIMAASIIAKTARDRWMVEFAKKEPLYEFEKHKGYPTKKHRLLIKEHGFSSIQRKSFNVSFPE